MNNTIEIRTHLEKKDLEAYCKALTEANLKLQLEVQSLRDKVTHLEELLVNLANVPIIGKKE